MYSLLLKFNPSSPQTLFPTSIPLPSSSSSSSSMKKETTFSLGFKTTLSSSSSSSSHNHSWFQVQPKNLKSQSLMAPNSQHDDGLHDLDTCTVEEEIDRKYKRMLLYMNHLSEREKMPAERFKLLLAFLTQVVKKSSGKITFVPMFDMVIYGLGCAHMVIYALTFLIKKDLPPNDEQGKDVTFVFGDELKHEEIESVGGRATSSRGVVYIVFNRAIVKDFFLKNEWVAAKEAASKKIGLKEISEAVEFAFQSDEQISVVAVPTLFFAV